MKTFKIENTGAFMTKLLSKEDFDSFLLCEAKLTLAISYTVNGRLRSDFFDSDEQSQLTEEFATWGTVRPLCYEIIKGKRLPLSMAITLFLPSGLHNSLMLDCDSTDKSLIHAFAISIRFDSKSLLLISSVEKKSFSMDKSSDEAWDNYVKSFLKKLEIQFDEI